MAPKKAPKRAATAAAPAPTPAAAATGRGGARAGAGPKAKQKGLGGDAGAAAATTQLSLGELLGGRRSLKIPVEAIIKEWRNQSKRGRYEGAVWRASALDPPATNGELTDEQLDRLAAHPDWRLAGCWVSLLSC